MCCLIMCMPLFALDQCLSWLAWTKCVLEGCVHLPALLSECMFGTTCPYWGVGGRGRMSGNSKRYVYRNCIHPTVVIQ